MDKNNLKKIRIINVVGARPNYMKIAPIMNEYKKYPDIKPLLVHTGQHYDEKMNHLFFEELHIPKPDVHLEVGSASHAVQTAKIMERFEPVVLEVQPDIVLVVGDVNSTIACALVAAKLGVKVVHVEAGLRSFDLRMPEEINRILTDRISDILFVTEMSAVANLLKEGIPEDKIHHVGNVMIDTLLKNLDKAKSSTIRERLNVKENEFALVTLHRPSNVDDFYQLNRIFQALLHISSKIPVVFPLHPRTKNRIHEFGLNETLRAADSKQKSNRIQLIDPLGYLDFLHLMASAKIVLTDSGGMQEETTILGTPCLTLRENTERPATIDAGGNQIVGTDPSRIIAGFDGVMSNSTITPERPEMWDGRAAERIVDIIVKEMKK